MASVRRKTGSKFYYACYRGSDGARMQVSTKETSRNRAHKIAISLEEAGQRRSSRGALMDAFNRISEDLYSAPLRVDTTRAFFDTTISQRAGEISASSARRYRQVADEFLKHLGPVANGPFRDVTYDQVVAFRTAVAERTSASNGNSYIKCLRNFFTRALAEWVILDDPTKRLKPLTKERRSASEKRRAFTPDEVGRLIEAATATSVEWKWLVILGSLTGQRLGDAATMHWSNVEIRGENLAAWKFSSGKTDREMALPLPRHVTECMSVELGSGGPGSDKYVFPDASTSYLVSDRTSPLSNQFAGILARAGIRAATDHKSHKEGRSRARVASKVGYHSFRHTVSSTLSAVGAVRSVIMDMVGHDSTASSEVYIHTELLQKAEAQAKLMAAIQPLSRFVSNGLPEASSASGPMETNPKGGAD